MFADADLSAKATRDPVAPAQHSKAAMTKINRRKLDDGSPVQSFSTLMAELSTLVRNTCRVPGATGAPDFEVLTPLAHTAPRARFHRTYPIVVRNEPPPSFHTKTLLIKERALGEWGNFGLMQNGIIRSFDAKQHSVRQVKKDHLQEVAGMPGPGFSGGRARRGLLAASVSRRGRRRGAWRGSVRRKRG
jgi:hypothetical protein